MIARKPTIYSRFLIISALGLALSGCEQTMDLEACVSKHVEATPSILAKPWLQQACKALYDQRQKNIPLRDKITAECILREFTGIADFVVVGQKLQKCDLS